jgi:hypothetical protein
MDTRTNRRLVAALLVAAGIAGGFFVYTAHRKAETALAATRDVSDRLDRMIATAGDISSAQQAYVAPGQPGQPWLERSAALLRQFAADVAAVRPRLRSVDAAPVVEDLNHGLQALAAIDGKARQDLEQGQNLLAADVIFSEGRDAAAALTTTIRGLGAAEQGAAAVQRSSLEHQQWVVLGIIGLSWVAGLFFLVPIRVERVEVEKAGAAESPSSIALSSVEPAALERPAGPPPVDLAAAADVCASLARISDTTGLHEVLARAATVLDARGIIVWMGAGEELFPTLAYGYGDRFVRQMGPIPRNAGNATAEAWRSGQMRTVASDVVSHGAIAAPLTSVAGCVGVFTAEVRQGREADPSTLAVAAMIAAQLAGIVPAWPAGSAARVEPASNAGKDATSETTLEAIHEPGPLAASGGA